MHIALIATAVLLNPYLPRYDRRDPGGGVDLYVRIDRWTGQAEIGRFQTAGPNVGSWASMRTLKEAAQLDQTLKEIDRVLQDK